MKFPALSLAFSGLLDIVFPPRCLICDRWDAPALCKWCEAGIFSIPEPFCHQCGRPIEENIAGENIPCLHCAEAARLGGWGFDIARAAGVFQGPLRAGIHRLKYNELPELAMPLGALLASRMIPDGLLIGRTYDGVIAIPLHPARERERGYNQSHLLAASVSEMTGVPLLEKGILTRPQKSPHQARMSLAMRRELFENTPFAVVQREQVDGKRLLLIDDVFTTGATVSACARVLKDADASIVDVATLAAGG
jgi:competence protein ComFC